MEEIARIFNNLGYTMRSGGAPGADSAFEISYSNMEIYLPWEGFNGKKGIVPPLNLEFVEKYHPKPSALSNAGKKLMSRNTYQVLGQDLKTPSEFVVCWTKDGKASGGTGQALRIAKDYNIPIYNLKTDLDKFKDFLRMKVNGII